MKRILLAALIAFAGAASLEGCVVAHAYGQAVVTDVPPDNHMRIVVVPIPWVGPDDGYKVDVVKATADKNVATLFPALVARLPQDFKLNGVDASATLLESGSPIPPPTDVRTLVLSPSKAWGTGVMGSGMDLNVILIDASHGVLWKGSIRMSTGNAGVTYDAAAVDHAAVPLLEQLRDAKMIDISWRRPTTP